MIRTRVVFTGVTGTPYYSNLFWVGTTAAEALDASAAHSGFFADIRSNITSGLSWATAGEAAVIDPVTGDLTGVFTVPGTPSVGTATGTPLPLATQAVLRINTAAILGGRRIRGKVFIPGLTTSANSSGTGPTSALVTSIVQAANTRFSGTSGSVVVWSKKNGVQVPNTGFGVSPTWGTLRSRKQ